MQLLNIVIVALAALVSTSDACKCVINGSSYTVATQPCCAQLNGNYNSGNGDCAASSISATYVFLELMRLHLLPLKSELTPFFAQFRSCCSTWELNGAPLTSDCDFPTLAELEKIDTPQGEGAPVKASA
ncbi:hypothetical protein C8R45DRAFT_1108292 [Mycena sanguinolenta]|nr:hypothetical protein C8R45DRAFT_1108292 [Mycena sanguinolenta]